jgi:molybdopterin molybdotransferase
MKLFSGRTCLSELLSVYNAKRRLLENFNPVGVEPLEIARATWRVLAEPVMAGFDLPLFSNSSMDGFAVQSADLQGADREAPVSLRVVEDIPAGSQPTRTLEQGQAARIMTGALLPEGADAVVPVEDTDFQYRDPGLPAPEQVRIYRAVKPGDYMRPRGEDLRAGEQVLQAPTRLRPQDVGVLAMLGIESVRVHRRPKVAVLSTGDELVPLGQPLEPGKIRDSNAYTLAALVETCGAQVLRLGIAGDSPQAVQALLDKAASLQADLILSTAGVSVGAFDYVRSVVETYGQLDFWRVNMRPGKPLAFGAYRGLPFIGLPGNPVSAFVGFEVFVRPALFKLAGLPASERPRLQVHILQPLESDGRESYLRARVDFRNGQWTAELAGHQGSGNLRSLVLANALLIVPSGVKSLAAGSEVQAWLLDAPTPAGIPE